MNDQMVDRPPRSADRKVAGLTELVIPRPLDTRKVLARGSYRSSQVDLLLSKYARIRSDLRVVALRSDSSLGHRAYAERVKEYLEQSKEELEGGRPNLPVAASLLAGADRSLVWLLSPDILRQRCDVTLEQLEQLRPKPNALINNLASAKSKPAAQGDSLDSDRELKQALEDGLNNINDLDKQIVVEEVLQARRLSVLICYLSLVLLLLLAAIPFTTTTIGAPDRQEGVVWPVFWPSSASDNRLTAGIFLVLAALGLAAIGAAGGVVSGMLKVRDSRATLTRYRTSLLNLGLKPLAGAVAAILLYIFLSWNIIKGLDVTSPGVFVLTAFLAGFSERYFLRVVRAAENKPEDSGSHRREP